jgi:hypothetical protein
MSRSPLVLTVLVLMVLSPGCGDEPDSAGAAWYEDVRVQTPAPEVEDLPPGLLDAAAPLPDDGEIRYAPVGHALLPFGRAVLEGRGDHEGIPVTRMGLIHLDGEDVGLDLVDWRRKDATELLKIRRDIAGVVHLDAKQICDDRLRAAIREASPDVLSLSFAPAPRIPHKSPACLADLGGMPLHLMVPAADGELVAALAGIEGLETLILRSPELDGEALTAIARSPSLRTLDLGAAQVGADGLVRLEGLASLESLSLFGTLADDTSMAHLPNPRGLRSLDLGFTAVGDAGLATVAEITALRVLGLWHTGVTDAGLQLLGALENLTALDLAGTRVGDPGVAHLTALEGLRRLDLTGTAVTDAGLAVLTSLPELEVLRLGGTGITDGGLLALAAFPRLRLLDLRSAAVSRGGVEALRRVRPEMDIRFGR